MAISATVISLRVVDMSAPAIEGGIIPKSSRRSTGGDARE